MDSFFDIELTDQLSEFSFLPFEGTVFRVTRKNVDPTAPSISGGRWALPSTSENKGKPILYTSLECEGAMAEISYFLAQLNPLPSKKLVIYTLHVTLSKVIQLNNKDLEQLGVDLDKYRQRIYTKTQIIGSAINFLGNDGLIVPSA